jgi:hypothetical protein
MNALHKITGYAKRTERLDRALDIPSDRLSDVMSLANVSPIDEGALGSYPLDAVAVHQISLKLGTALNADAFDWFLEPFSVN